VVQRRKEEGGSGHMWVNELGQDVGIEFLLQHFATPYEQITWKLHS